MKKINLGRNYLYNNALIRDTMNHFSPVGIRFYKGLSKNGINVFYLPKEQSVDLEQIDGKIDIFIDSPNRFDQNYYNELKRFKELHNCKILVALCEYSAELNKFEDLIDYFYNTTVQFNELRETLKKNNLNYIDIPFSADEDSFMKINVNKDIDISFVGTLAHGTRFRESYIDNLFNKGYNLYFSGFDNYGFTEYSDLNEIFNRSKINLNIHYKEQFDKKIDFNEKIFSCALSGNFQLNNHPYIKVFFGDYLPVIDKDNYLEVLEFYMKNYDKAEEIALRMREDVLLKHTDKIRMKELLEKI